MIRRLRFGTFLAPHHPTGEDPTLLLERDVQLAEHLDRLGFDEFWCGEHHSTGWEIISSPELFLAHVAARTSRIRLGTGVVSLPYHHPFHVANRIVLLDHLSRGRVIFGSGPGAIPTDQWTLGLDPMVLRDRHDEALGVIVRLLRGDERFTHESDWFTLRDARLQMLPVQHEVPMAASSSLSPSGMRLAGKYGIGVLSIASNSTEGIQALPTQWGFAEEAAAQHGHTVDRADWRVLLTWHVAESRERAEADVRHGLLRWNNEYKAEILQRPGDVAYDDPDALIDSLRGGGATGIGAAVIGTPDDLVTAIRRLQEFTGGFGVVLGFAHDWADPDATRRSWELIARHVVPQLNGTLEPLLDSARYVRARMPELVPEMTAAVMSRIMSDERAAEAFRVTARQKADGAGSAFRPGVDLTAAHEPAAESDGGRAEPVGPPAIAATDADKEEVRSA